MVVTGTTGVCGRFQFYAARELIPRANYWCRRFRCGANERQIFGCRSGAPRTVPIYAVRVLAALARRVQQSRPHTHTHTLRPDDLMDIRSYARCPPPPTGAVVVGARSTYVSRINSSIQTSFCLCGRQRHQQPHKYRLSRAGRRLATVFARCRSKNLMSQRLQLNVDQ